MFSKQTKKLTRTLIPLLIIRAGRVVQAGIMPSKHDAKFKPQCHQNKKTKTNKQKA
jgi:hypothetical protein